MNNLHLKDSVCMNNLHLTASFMPFSILTPRLLGWSKQFVGWGEGDVNLHTHFLPIGCIEP